MHINRRRLFCGMGAWLLALALTAWGLLPAHAQAGVFFYIPQRGTPAAIANFVQPEAGCNWTGIGGQVFDRNGAPVSGLVVKLSGVFEGQAVLRYAVTGSSQAFGSGGFDFPLADHPVASRSLTIQLLDVGGLPRSSPVVVATQNICTSNLTILNLREASLAHPLYFPIVRK